MTQFVPNSYPDFDTDAAGMHVAFRDRGGSHHGLVTATTSPGGGIEVLSTGERLRTGRGAVRDGLCTGRRAVRNSLRNRGRRARECLSARGSAVGQTLRHRGARTGESLRQPVHAARCQRCERCRVAARVQRVGEDRRDGTDSA